MMAVAYVRVSTDRQASDDRTSLADQRAAIEKLAEQLGVQVGWWFEDAGVSGATAEKRPGFMAMLNACKADPQPKGAHGVVLMLNASRFGRWNDSEDATWYRVEFKRSGWDVRFAEGDAQGDHAPIIHAVASMEASAYRRNLIANTRRGKKGSAELGFWNARAPFGYRRQVVSTGRVLEDGEHKSPAEKVRLAPHDAEAEIVRWVFESYAAGLHTLGTLSAALLERVPGRRWSRTVVNHLLRNPAYRGAVVGGRRRGESPELYGKEAAHPPIVTLTLWEAAQGRLMRHAKLGRGVRSYYLLSGLMVCSRCGHTYAGGGGPANPKRKFYRDSGGIAGVCPGKIGTVMRHLVEGKVIGMLAETVPGPEVRSRLEHAAAEELRTDRGAESRLRAERRSAELKRDRLIAAVAEGSIRSRDAARQIAQHDAAIEEANRKLQVVRFRSRQARDTSLERDQLVQRALDFPSMAAHLEGPALRAYLEPWLANVTFDKRSRKLVVAIRPTPAASFRRSGMPGLAGRENDGLIVRRASLLQPGHEYRVEEAAELVRRGRTA